MWWSLFFCRNWCTLGLLCEHYSQNIDSHFNVSVEHKNKIILDVLPVLRFVLTPNSPPSRCPDDKRRHGLHSGQRQARRAVGNASQPANKERLLHCHVSSGGPEVLIEDLLLKCGAQEGG